MKPGEVSPAVVAYDAIQAALHTATTRRDELLAERRELTVASLADPDAKHARRLGFIATELAQVEGQMADLEQPDREAREAVAAEQAAAANQQQEASRLFSILELHGYLAARNACAKAVDEAMATLRARVIDLDAVNAIVQQRAVRHLPTAFVAANSPRATWQLVEERLALMGLLGPTEASRMMLPHSSVEQVIRVCFDRLSSQPELQVRAALTPAPIEADEPDELEAAA